MSNEGSLEDSNSVHESKTSLDENLTLPDVIGSQDFGPLESTVQCENLSELFTEELTLIGRVPMQFFLPECEESAALRDLIHQFGGICIYIVECCSY